MHRVITMLILVVGVLATTPVARAADYYVAKTGNDGPNLCTLASPCLTIRQGVNKLTAGDTLYIRAGTYNETTGALRLANVPSGTSWANPVRITAFPISGSGYNTVYEEVIVTPTETGPANIYIFLDGDAFKYIIFEGFIIDGRFRMQDAIQLTHDGSLLNPERTACGTASEATGPGPMRFLNMEVRNTTGSIVGVSFWSHDIEFRNIHAHHNLNGHCYYVQSQRLRIDGGQIHDCEGYGIQHYQNIGGIFPEYEPLGCPLFADGVISNVRIYNSGQGGIIIGGGTQGAKAYNNVIYGTGTGLVLSPWSSVARGITTSAWNNTLWNNRNPGLQITRGFVNVRNNVIDRLTTSSQATADGGIVMTNNIISTTAAPIDPKFVSPASGDFRIQSDSPAINAGATIAEVATDIAGTVRPQPTGGSYDIGAYEFVTGAAPFAFDLSASGNVTIVLGGVASTTLGLTLTGGTTAAATFALSALPAGVTAAFSPTTCTPTCTSTLTFTAAPVSLSGTFPITVSATAGGLTRTTTFTLNVNCPPTDSQLVAATMTNVAAFARATYSANQSPVWNRGVLHNGMTALYQSTGDAAALAYVDAFGAFNTWTLTTGGAIPDRLIAGYAWTDSYAVDPQAVKIANTRTIVQGQLTTGLPSYNYVDALFMGVPMFIRMAKIDNQQSFRDRAQVLFNNIHTTTALWDSVKHLYYRDASYITATSPNGKKVLWSRGNGWAYAGLARILQELPPEDPSRAAYVTTFLDMSAALIPIQRSDGFWNANLDDPNHFGGPETSGTSLFTYGMAWGIRSGLLTSETYRPVVDRAWDGMVMTAVQGNGRLGYVQAVGGQPAASDINSSQDFGYGAFLLAGSEMYQLRGGSPIGISTEN